MKKTFNNITIKAFIAFAGMSVFALPIKAQQLPDPTLNVPAPNAPPSPPPGPVPYPALVNMTASTQSYNFIKTYIPDEPMQAFAGGTYYRMNSDYFDGLGRPLQSVALRGHAGGNDIVVPHVYDALGRETYQFLPFAAPLSSSSSSDPTNPGKIKMNVVTQLRGFYDHLGPDEQPFSKTEFDNSPLDRVTKQFAPGKNWVGAPNGGRGVTFTYRTNDEPIFSVNFNAFAVKGSYPHFSIGYNMGALPVYDGNYEPGQLTIISQRDEDGKLTEEIKDKSGRIVMKRTLFNNNAPYTNASPEKFPNNYTYTIYVYDDIGRLRVVMPPEVSKAIPNGMTMPGGGLGSVGSLDYTWSISSDQLSGLCYQYLYDERDRLVEKKIPGKDVEYYIYDKRNRLVFYQDGNMRSRPQPVWAFTFYDALNRPTVTGEGNTAASRQILINYLYNTSGWPSTEWLYYVQNYDLYHTYPTTLNGCKILSYTYYDDYNQGNLSNFYYDYSQFSGITGNNTVVASPDHPSTRTRGLATGTKTLVMDPDDPNADHWLTTVNYYDDNGRIIQTQSENIKGGTDISSNVYYFQGMLYKNILKHQNPEATVLQGSTDPSAEFVTIEKTFDRNLRIDGGNDLVSKIHQKINGGTDYILATYNYDHLNRNVVKQYQAGNVLQEYNIRGFLNHIQFEVPGTIPAVNTPNTSYTGIHFEEKLFYDKGFGSQLYNGNIAGIVWSGSDWVQKAYGYSYDNLNRLTYAQYNQQNDVTNADADWKHDDYDLTAANISYDLNGNLKTMKQMHSTPLTPDVTMDDMTYNYFPNSNQLNSVDESSVSVADPLLPDFKDNHTGTNDYSYDANGNLKYDLNKHISTNITYTSLNKPDFITVDGGKAIAYVYDAEGNRLQKRIKDDNNGVNETWDYIGNFVYKNNELQYILNDEGRTRPVVSGTNGLPSAPAGTPTKFVYDFFIKDHLGDVRSTVTATPASYLYYARHELASANTENLFFDNIPSVRDLKPGSTDPEDGMAARLNGGESDHRVGTAIMLQVKAGDRFQISAKSFYDGDYTQRDEAGSNDVLESLVTALSGGMDYYGTPLAELPDNVKTLQTILGQNPALADQLAVLTETNNNPDAPKAHLNYLFFDEKMSLSTGFSGSVQVAQNGINGGNWNTIYPFGNGTVTETNIEGSALCTTCGSVYVTPGNGYLLVYIDNQSIGKDVWFDNLSIGEYTSSVLEEDHYYPYGLCLNQTPNTTGANPNPYKYQGIELEKHFGLETYETFYRGLDPQLGRFNSIDPKCDINIDPSSEDEVYGTDLESISPYASMGNDPARYTDPKGDVFGIDNLIGAVVGAAVDYGVQVAANYVNDVEDPWTNNINLTSIATAAVAGGVTSGGSTVKTLVKVGAAVINNTVEVKTNKKTGVNVKVQKNPLNIVKNTALDLTIDGATGRMGSKVEKKVVRTTITNGGRLNRTARTFVRSTGANVTRRRTRIIRTVVKAAGKAAGKTTENGTKAVASKRVDAAKENSDLP